MTPFTTLVGPAIPFGMKNVDTDVIIPGRWLKTVSRKGLAVGAFEALRSSPDNLFDDPRFKGAPILLAGENFGCGSSREHAAWALADMGIRVVIAPRFADIFASNAFKNGILLIELAQDELDTLLRLPSHAPIKIDLPAQSVAVGEGITYSFEIDPFRKHCLVHGIDEIDITLENGAGIQAYRERLGAERPWIGIA
jgi:3-isopropylmalate/(R)-2-methylmalate dehydratase small subunit